MNQFQEYLNKTKLINENENEQSDNLIETKLSETLEAFKKANNSLLELIGFLEESLEEINKEISKLGNMSADFAEDDTDTLDIDEQLSILDTKKFKIEEIKTNVEVYSQSLKRKKSEFEELI